MEEVSDWLTKILLGIRLTQIPAILKNLKILIDFLVPALGNKESSASLAICLITLFSINGFIYGYLRTRSEIPNFLRGEGQRIAESSGNSELLQDQLFTIEEESSETLGKLKQKQN